MVTVMRADGLRIVIYLNDHSPAHVHVFGDGEAKISLSGPGGVPDLVWADSMTGAAIRRAMQLVTGQQAFSLAQWGRIHGRTD